MSNGLNAPAMRQISPADDQEFTVAVLDLKRLAWFFYLVQYTQGRVTIRRIYLYNSTIPSIKTLQKHCKKCIVGQFVRVLRPVMCSEDFCVGFFTASQKR